MGTAVVWTHALGRLLCSPKCSWCFWHNRDHCQWILSLQTLDMSAAMHSLWHLEESATCYKLEWLWRYSKKATKYRLWELLSAPPPPPSSFTPTRFTAESNKLKWNRLRLAETSCILCTTIVFCRSIFLVVTTLTAPRFSHALQYQNYTSYITVMWSW